MHCIRAANSFFHPAFVYSEKNPKILAITTLAIAAIGCTVLALASLSGAGVAVMGTITAISTVSALYYLIRSSRPIQKAVVADKVTFLKIPISNAEIPPPLHLVVENQLYNWCEEIRLKDTPRYQLRRVAAERMLNVYKDPQLTILDLSGLKLSSLPDCIGQIPHLKGLDISKNQLKTLPDSVGDLSKLRFLSVDENQFALLPDCIRRLSCLEQLVMCSNQLESLPDFIGNLSSLTLLNFKGNQLESLPDSIGRLSKLKCLAVTKNRLKSLPDSIGNLPVLTSLALADNQSLMVRTYSLSKLFTPEHPFCTIGY
jgi:hypothetical protein